MATMEKPKLKQKKKKTRYKLEDETIEDIQITPDIVEETNELEETLLKTDESCKLNDAPICSQTENVLPEIDTITKKINEDHEKIQSEEVLNICVNTEALKKATEQCKDLAEAAKNLQQVLPPLEQATSKSDAVENINGVKTSAPSYIELSSVINKLKLSDASANKVKNTPKVMQPQVVPFTFGEIENIFGIKEITAARSYVIEFEKYEMQAPVPTHPLYEALTEYQQARSQLILNEREVKTLSRECTDKLGTIWYVNNRSKTVGDRCADGLYFDCKFNYLDATLRSGILTEYKRGLSLLREKATEAHSQHSHAQRLLKIQIDEIVWLSMVSELESMKDSLRILFWVLRTSGWGYDKELRKQLRFWCCSLAKALLKKDDSSPNMLFLLHHILRVTQNIGWAIHLIDCKITKTSDICKALCLLEAILFRSMGASAGPEERQTRIRKITDGQESDFVEVPIAAEAIDDSLWTVVDSDGEGAEIEVTGTHTGGTLREDDIVNLIRQIPFESIFKELMVVRNNGNEMVFCGANLGGGSTLRVFASIRMFLNIIRTGLLSYKNYQELTRELCRLALHSVMYCTDLWEIASKNCEANLYERLSSEYNSVFLATWSTLECAGSRDISTLFLSEVPFKLIWIDSINTLYKKMADNLIVSDSIWCYYTLVGISNMAIAREEEDFIIKIIKFIYKIGFSSDFSELGCGEWARTLSGSALYRSPHLIGPVLLETSHKAEGQWLEVLPLQMWHPQTGEILNLISTWKDSCPELIPHLLKGMDWSCKSGIDFHTQKSVALFLSAMAQQMTVPKTQPPEWIWECLLILKIHCYDWKVDSRSTPDPQTIQGLDVTGKCHVSSVLTMLTTTWGYSVPLVFQNSAPLLLKLANSGRFAEVVHALYYIVPILGDCPDSIAQCKNFKDLLTILMRTEKTYTKMATRLVMSDFPGPIIKMLVNMIQAQLKYYDYFSLQSPRTLLMVWVYWLTSIENWQTDWIAVHILDVALGCCFSHHDAMTEAANLFSSFVQTSSQAKSPTSSGFSWLWNSNSSFKGLVQCNIEAPYVWHATLWMEHGAIERSSGLWQRLVEKLTCHKEGNKVNIDKTLKSVGGSDNSGSLVLYRSVQYATSMSLGHPIYSLIWQLFFYIYFDISFLTGNVAQRKLVGPLFFQGVVNSRLLGKARARLIEARTYHEEKAKEFSNKGISTNAETEHQKAFHLQQAHLMNAYHSWLDFDITINFNDPKTFSQPFIQKLHQLISGQNSIWIETIDNVEISKFQPSHWPVAILQDGSRQGSHYTLASKQISRSKTPETSPTERILSRLRTYEKPIMESKELAMISEIEPVIDPTVARDFNRVFELMHIHLKELGKCAKKYECTCNIISSIDGNMYDLVPKLYEKREYCKNIVKSCGPNCQGSASFVIEVHESKLKEEINCEMSCNRNNHQTVLDKAMEPYDDLAIHTAIISKLAQLACSGTIKNINNGGVTLFNIVLNALKEDIMQFPPANQVLTTVATQLGEKFISSSGAQCVNLVNRLKGSNFIGLMGSLLRPSQLSTSEMLDVYTSISMNVTDTHMAFSFLSKFHISAWLHEVRPGPVDRNKFISLVCNALGAAGCEPSDERLMLHELMCVHLSRVLAWEFPLHLSHVLSTLCSLSLEKKLPPDTWQHCITVIETYPHLLSCQQACENMELIAQQWWQRRGTWGPNGLAARYGLYCPPMGRLGALLASTTLSTAMLHQPPLLTHQICSVVFDAMRAFWNVWVAPWWGGGAQAAAWVADLARGPALMPWAPDDSTTPDIMLDAMVETLTYCSRTLPGSTNDLLSLTWQWYVRNFAHVAVASHVLIRVHKALLKLPWSADPQHWLTFIDLPTVAKVADINLMICHEFTLKCLGSRKWQSWLTTVPEPLRPQALNFIFHILFKLCPEQQVLDDALLLPWELLKIEPYEEIINYFMASFNTSILPFHNSKLVPLICAAGGLTIGSESSPDWQSKRACLVKGWVSAISSLSQGKADTDKKNGLDKDISASIANLLLKIESTVMSLVGASDMQKIMECSFLLSGAISMLSMTSLETAQQEWIGWINTTSKLCITSLIGCLLQVTQRDAFASLAEQSVLVFFKHEGEWSYIFNTWKNNCIVPVEYLITNSALLTAVATYKSIDKDRYQGSVFQQLDKDILQTLHCFEPVCSCEKQSSLWVCYMISLIEDTALDVPNRLTALNHIAAILEKWSQEPSWGLFKAIRLVQNTTPTYRFRVITRFALCLTLSQLQKFQDLSNTSPSNNSFLKTLSSLEVMADQKQCADVKHIINKCTSLLKDKSNLITDPLQSISELCSDLYCDVNYLKNANDIFK